MTGADDNGTRYVVPAVARAVAMLQLFSSRRRTLSAAEMARELNIPRSTVFRLAHTLEHLGLLKRVDGGHSFQLGIGILGLGFEYLASLDLAEVARPMLEQLRDETGLSCHMVVPDGQDVVVVLKAAGNSAFSSNLSIGTRLPAHGTVLGRMVLCDRSVAELREMYPEEPLPAFTEQTPTTVEQLAALLAEDRKRGYAISNSYFEHGVSAVAAPVFDRYGQAVAAINVTVPGGMRAADDLVENVRRTAAAMSRALHYPADDRAAVAG